MIIRLHHLSARAPTMQDASAIANLIDMCEEDIVARGGCWEEKLRHIWENAAFQICSDAWVIVTRQDQIVGYADVRRQSEPSLFVCALVICVHPDYRGRGIETLLIRLAEDRVRHIGRNCALLQPVHLRVEVSVPNGALSETLQQEGYMPMQTFVRMSIALERITCYASNSTDGLFTLDVSLHTDSVVAMTTNQSAVDIQQTQRYTVYAKILSPGPIQQKDQARMLSYAIP